MTKRPFRFSVQSFIANTGTEWRERARKAEDLGYSTLQLADHFMGPGDALAATRHPPQNLSAIPAIAVAAEATSTLRVGCRVFCVDYHVPAVFVHQLATLDVLSEGRLEIGLGAGWIKNEYEAAGIPFDPPAKRIDRLGEVVELLKAHMGEGEISIDGEYVSVKNYEGNPKSIQKPHPPLMIGGGSERILKLAGKVADIVSFNYNNRSGMLGEDGVRLSTAEETLRKLAWVKQGAGARFDEIELEIGAYKTFVGQGDELAKQMGDAMGLSVDDMKHHPHALFGSVDEICDELERRRDEYGISYVNVMDIVFEDFAPVVARLNGK
jgi:probable F420-dependent oxidoreductase